ncbi:MAG: porin [Candidatus Methylomirabilia bacterium]
MKRWVVWGLALLFGAGLVAMPSPVAADLKVGVSGYVKLDMQYSDKLMGSVPSPSPAGTPLDTSATADNSQTIFDARQSRLRVTFSDEIMGIKTSGRIETDFFTGDGNARVSNSRHLRLRHAYARGDHPSGFFLLAGQTWSLSFNAAVAAPLIVDFNGPAGQMFARQPQLRAGWKGPMGGGNLILEAAVEKHSLNDLGSASVSEAQGQAQDVPLFGGKISWHGSPVKFEAYGGIAKNTIILASGRDVDETATLFQVSAETKFNPLTLYAHYQHIDGLQRLGNGDFTDAFLVGSDVRNVESNGFFVGAGLKAAKNTSLNAVFGWNDADECTACGFTGTSLEEHQSIHVNVIQKFWQRWQAGLEYRHFEVEAFNGDDGDVNIVHGAFWFFF